MPNPRFSISITLDGQPCIANVPPGSRAWRKANAVFCPLGEAPTRAWVLTTKEIVDGLTETGTHTLTWIQQGADGVISRTLSFTGLYLVTATRVLPGGPGDSRALYLVELADSRWVLGHTAETGSLNANIRSYAQDDEYLTGTHGATWTNLGQALWSACGLLGAWPGLPFAPDAQPENTRFIGVPAWRALTEFLDLLDCAVAHNPLTNTYTIVQLGAAQVIPAEESSLTWNAEPESFTANRIPATVRVYFHAHYRAYGQERDTEIDNNWSYNGAGVFSDVATGVTGAIGRVALWDDLPYVIENDGSDDNSSARLTRATARKTRLVTRRSVERQHRIHAGLLSSILPGGQVRATLWRSWDTTDQSIFGGTVTEFIAGPDLIRSLPGVGGLADCCQAESLPPEREHYGPPDLGRYSYPNYPRLPNIVQVWHSGEVDPGDVVAPSDAGTVGSDLLHRGKVRRFVEGSLTVLEDCWILFVDDYDNAAGAVTAIQGECYGPGRLSGTETNSSGETLPLYTVRKGMEAADEFVWFELTANLTPLSSNAAANKLNLDLTDTGVDIQVFDPYTAPGMWRGSTGYKGLARKRSGQTAGRQNYNIVWMETIARWIRGTITGSTGPTWAQTTDHYHLQGKDPGNPDVVDPFGGGGGFPDIIAGCQHWSHYNDRDGRYEITWAQRAAIFARGTAPADNCNGDTFGEPGNWSIKPIGDYVADPGPPATVLNPYRFRCAAGDVIGMRRITNTQPFVWEVVACEVHQVRNVTSDGVTGAFRVFNGKLQAFFEDQAVYRCPNGVWEDVVPINLCNREPAPDYPPEEEE